MFFSLELPYSRPGELSETAWRIPPHQGQWDFNQINQSHLISPCHQHQYNSYFWGHFIENLKHIVSVKLSVTVTHQPKSPFLQQERLIGEIDKLRNEIDHLKRRSGAFGDGTHPRYALPSAQAQAPLQQAWWLLMFCACDLRSHLGSSSDLRFSMVEGQDGHYSTTVIRRAQKGRLSALRDDPNKVLRRFREQEPARCSDRLQLTTCACLRSCLCCWCLIANFPFFTNLCLFLTCCHGHAV